MSDYLVSVIMPVYNVEKYIAKSIESVLAQTYPNFELLVVDDGSPDGSFQIANKFVENDFRVQVLRKPNGGLSDARNYGMEHAKGRFVFFIDSDDWVEPDFLKFAIDQIVKHDSKVVIFGYHLDNLDLTDNLLVSTEVCSQSKTFLKSQNNLILDSNLLGILGYAWNKIYDLQYIKSQNLLFTKGVSLVEDILFNAPFYACLDKIVVSKRSFYHYNNRPIPTLIKKFHLNSFELYLLKTNALEKFLLEWNVPEVDRVRILAYSWIDGIRYCIDNMIRFTSNLTLSQQVDYTRKIMNHPHTKRFVSHYNVQSLLSKIYKYLIMSRQSWLLLLFLKFKKQFYVS